MRCAARMRRPPVSCATSCAESAQFARLVQTLLDGGQEAALLQARLESPRAWSAPCTKENTTSSNVRPPAIQFLSTGCAGNANKGSAWVAW